VATTFKIQYAGNVTPIEEPQLTDTDDTARAIHSSIDKAMGGGDEISCGATSTNVNYKSYTTSTGYVALNNANIFNTGNMGSVIDFLAFAITATSDSGTPDLVVSLDSGTTDHLKLKDVGDVSILRVNALNGTQVQVKSSAGATCTVDILYGLES